jgi:hypothetical protein
VAAYTAMWTDYANAALTANYKDQRLTQHATDAALSGPSRVSTSYSTRACEGGLGPKWAQ